MRATYPTHFIFDIIILISKMWRWVTVMKSLALQVRFCQRVWNSKGFWWWCVTFIATRFLDFVHRPDFHKQENTTFRKLDLFPSSGEGVGAPTLQGTKLFPTHRRGTKSRNLVVMSVWNWQLLGLPTSLSFWAHANGIWGILSVYYIHISSSVHIRIAQRSQLLHSTDGQTAISCLPFLFFSCCYFAF
jgi:hypothetical protein